MYVSGFTFIRNAIQYDYPILEAIKSILPICDEVVVAVGKSEDETLQLIKSLDSEKIKIIVTVWDDSLREGGEVLAKETDKAFAAINPKADWCFYIQGDEVIHEKYLDVVYEGMKQWENDPAVDGLLFHYLHFYGSYDYVATSSGWYKKEIRIIRNNKKIYSYRDAQGFRKEDNQKLCVKPIDAYIYHYGWVKPPAAMQAKQHTFQKLWHTDRWIADNIPMVEEYDYGDIDVLTRFDQDHPMVMKERIERLNWKFTRDISKNKISLKEKLKSYVQKHFGLDFNYKNYRIIK
ncbi:MAG: glycosyltransferase family 2 protein [Saprospiraceae bacterium]